MEIIYQGVDITDSVQIAGLKIYDESAGKCDSAEITLENISAWLRWAPMVGDEMEIREGGISTGVLYIDTMQPDRGHYRLLLTGLNRDARTQKNAMYKNMTFAEIARECAAECRCEALFYGINTAVRYECITRKAETAPAFMERLANMEGAVLKMFGGRMVFIGIEYAMERQAHQTMELSAWQGTYTLKMRPTQKAKAMHVIAPEADVWAYDSSAPGGTLTRTDLPAQDSATAGRWARGLLMINNMDAEMLEITTELNTGMTAMTRIDISSAEKQLEGRWIIRRCEHDLMGRATRTCLIRTVGTIK